MPSSSPGAGLRMKGRLTMLKGLRRIALALGSVAVLALAGGAHFKAG